MLLWGCGLCLGFGFHLVISGFPLSWWQDQCEDGSALAANPFCLLSLVKPPNLPWFVAKGVSESISLAISYVSLEESLVLI